MKKISLLLLLAAIQHLTWAQSYRGLTVVSNDVVWMSGSRGHVLRTCNGGQGWDTLNPPGYGRKDFRDIHAWDSLSAIIMSSGDSAVVLKTNNGGKSWKVVLESNRPGVFFDAMDFETAFGVIIGDPYVDDKDGASLFDLYYSGDYGNSWVRSQHIQEARFTSLPGEALYAASGTNIEVIKNDTGYAFGFVTGGGAINRYISNTGEETVIPLKQGETCGAYGFCKKGQQMIAVGGSYLQAGNGDSTSAWWDTQKESWILAETAPGGYRSCVCVNEKNLWVTTGSNGTDYTDDGGRHWSPAAIPGYNVCAFSKNFLWLAGDKGRWEKVPLSKIKQPVKK